jgi:energy-coupling factor transport system substrate-specific component
MNKLFKVSTRTIVATGIGAALFALLFMYVKVPSPIPNTDVKVAYGFAAFMATLFGPIAGALIAFIGHFINDTVLWGGAWWSWVIASGVAGFIFGFAFTRIDVESGKLTTKDIVTFNVIQVVGNIVAWFIVAPVLDILIYAEPVEKLFWQGLMAGTSNAILTGVVGTLLLVAYTATRTQKGSLTKE